MFKLGLKSFQGIFQVLDERNIPFAAYRLPYQDEYRLLIQTESFPMEISDIVELDMQEGFLIAPFPGKNKGKIFLLQPDISVQASEINNELIERLKKVKLFDKIKRNPFSYIDTVADDFQNQVDKAKSNIVSEKFNKVVLSRVKVEKRPHHLSEEKLFNKFCAAYPHAMVYYLRMPDTGTWMGATPEPLLIEKNGKLKTVSLAGTQVLGSRKLEDVKWGAKEIAEQAIVSRFIFNLIDGLGVKDFQIKGPENFQAANLVHLNTSFIFDKKAIQLKKGEFVEILHPTPSICGLPRQEAADFIRSNEKHDRSYYTGVLGPVNDNAETHLYVNLRCMQLFEHEIVLYSGAGITDSSSPEKEWVETSNKLLTLLRYIHV